MARSVPDTSPRLGIFGGTFDPPHVGHVALIRAAREALALDQIIVVPTSVPPHRPTPELAGPLRERLAKAAFSALDRVTVSDLERTTGDAAPTYTIDTVLRLANDRPGALLFVLLGADALMGLRTWRSWRTICAHSIIAVVGRPALVSPADLASEIRWLRDQNVEIVEVPMEPSAASAAEVRRLVAASSWAELADVVPADVLDLLRAELGAAC